MEDAPTPPRRTPGPRPLLGDDPRERLYEAALQCIARRGFRKTSMGDIAEEAGVSRPTVYTYFPSKLEIVLEVLVRENELLLAGVARGIARRRGHAAIVEAVYLGIVASLENTYFQNIVEGGGEGSALSAQVLAHERFRAGVQGFWVPLLQRGIDRGEIRSDRPVEELVDWVVFVQFSLVTLGGRLGLDRPAMRRQVADYLLPALAAR